MAYRDSIRWALSVEGLTTHEQSVLTHLAYKARHPWNRAWPTLGGIASDTSMSRRHVRKCIAVLKDRGLIWETGKGGKYNQNVYQLAGTCELIPGGDRDTARWKTILFSPQGGVSQTGGVGLRDLSPRSSGPTTTTSTTTMPTTTPAGAPF